MTINSQSQENLNIEITKITYNNNAAKYFEKQQPISATQSDIDKYISLLPQTPKVLDLGCGVGRDSEYFCQKGCQVTGIDFSEEMLCLAKKNVKKAKFEIRDIRNIDYPQSEFDGVWAMASLLHISYADIGNVFKNVSRILKVNGIFFVSVMEGKSQKLESHKYFVGKRFFVRYRRKFLEKMAFENGFEILKSETVMFINKKWVRLLMRKIS
ncbi:MAG: methyltransferase domain-containing protein [Patescibacteria group bacterium]